MTNGTGNSRNFQISGKKGQPLEVVQNFRNEFPEMFCSIRFCTGISGNFGPMDRAQDVLIPGADQKDRGLWGRDWSRKNYTTRKENSLPKQIYRLCVLLKVKPVHSTLYLVHTARYFPPLTPFKSFVPQKFTRLRFSVLADSSPVVCIKNLIVS